MATDPRRNEVDPFELSNRITAIVCVVALLTAPCTFGASLLATLGPLLGAALGRALFEREVAQRVDTTVARAWSGATLMIPGAAYRYGILWVEGDELRFAAAGESRRWRLADLDGLALEVQQLYLRGLCWGQGDAHVRVSVPDPDGWMRVLSGA